MNDSNQEELTDYFILNQYLKINNSRNPKQRRRFCLNLLILHMSEKEKRERERRLRSRKEYTRQKITRPKSWNHVQDGLTEVEFKTLFRMTKGVFRDLFDILNVNEIFKRDEQMILNPLNGSVEAKCILSCLILYLGGTHIPAICAIMGQSRAQVQKNIDISLEAVLRKKSTFIRFPVESDELINVANGFNEKTFGFHESITTMQGCVGCLDGMVQPIEKDGRSTLNDLSQFSVKTGKSSIVLIACCDSNYSLLSAECKTYGSCHDNVAFLLTDLYHLIYEKQVLGKHGTIPKFWIAADSAFTCTDYVLTPYKGSPRNATKQFKQKIRGFNEKLSSLRVHIEQTFGMLKGIMRILRQPLEAKSMKKNSDILIACCCIYNFIMKNKVYNASNFFISERITTSGSKILGSDSVRQSQQITFHVRDDTNSAQQFTIATNDSNIRDTTQEAMQVTLPSCLNRRNNTSNRENKSSPRDHLRDELFKHYQYNYLQKREQTGQKLAAREMKRVKLN